MTLHRLVFPALAAAFALALPSQAGVSVRNVTAVQRYPWNGLVDIDYEVVCDDPAADVYVFPEGTDNDTGALLLMKTLAGDGASGAVKPGTHRMTWNAAKDQPNFHSTSFSVKMTAISGAAPYIVIDLSGGANAASYPVRFSAVGPNLDDDTCRTTELWLRLILPGTFTMGSPAAELGRSSDETQHSVTISKPFYMGVFETTYKQYDLIMGNKSSSYNGGGLTAIGMLSYDELRGKTLGAAWPSHNQVDADSFFGTLRARTSLTLDLPTEAQWEYACRAGTTTALNIGLDLTNPTGRDSAMDTVGRYADTEGYSSKVGSFLPNNWGLYDMHGGVWEWCLDWSGKYPTGTQTDPVGVVSGSYRILRGGCASAYARYCRSAARYSNPPSRKKDEYYQGFRLCCSAGQ